MRKPKHRRSLRAFREHYNLSQQFVADQIGINDVTVYRIETGISQPRGLTARAIERWMDEFEARQRETA